MDGVYNTPLPRWSGFINPYLTCGEFVTRLVCLFFREKFCTLGLMKTFDNHEAQVESGIIDGKMLDFVPTNTYPEFATNSPIPYLSKNKALQDSYEITPSNTVNIDGVILNVDRNTLRTPAVIVDALLAHGEALDCFNMQLQNEGVKETQEKNRALTNENAKQELILETLNAITDPVQRAEAMAKIFYPPASNDSNHTSV